VAGFCRESTQFYNLAYAVVQLIMKLLGISRSSDNKPISPFPDILTGKGLMGFNSFNAPTYTW